MDQLELPTVRSDETTGGALGAMRKAGTRAVLVETGREFRLLRNIDLMGSGPGQTVGRLAPLGARAIRVATRVAVEARLDREGIQLGVLRGAKGMATLVTRHEYLAQVLRATPRLCQCSGSGHISPAPPAEDGKPCVYGDGTYECY